MDIPKKIILFDLNETLVFRGSKVFVRPHALEVLIRLNQKYDLGIASSCILKNIENLLTLIFEKLDWRLYIKYIFDRTYTTPHPLEDKPYHTLRDVEKIKKVLQGDVLFIDNEESKYLNKDCQRIIVSSYQGGRKDKSMLELERKLYLSY